MKRKHNKKRNTAFLFEALVIELTKSLVGSDTSRSSYIRGVLAEHFHKNTNLFEELECYSSLESGQELDRHTAEKLLFLTKKKHENLDAKSIFESQTAVINKVNKNLGREVFNNFVKEYKNYASLSQIFGTSLPPRSQVLLEKKIIGSLMSLKPTEAPAIPIDSLVVKTFVENFNQQYENLLEEQKQLLEKYVVSLSPTENVEFRVYLGKELRRIEEEVQESFNFSEIREDKHMTENTHKVLSEMKKINISNITPEGLLQILKLQKLTSEYKR